MWLYKAVYYVGATICVGINQGVCVLVYLESVRTGLPAVCVARNRTPQQCVLLCFGTKRVWQGTVCRLSRRVSHESETLSRAARARESERHINCLDLYLYTLYRKAVLLDFSFTTL